MERQMKMVRRQISMKGSDQAAEDLQYWLSKTPQERIAAVTFLITQTLAPGQRMDKTKVAQIKFKK